MEGTVVGEWSDGRLGMRADTRRRDRRKTERGVQQRSRKSG